MEYKLELVVVPVSDVDHAKDFYVDRMGFTLDVDHQAGDAFRSQRDDRPRILEVRDKDGLNPS